MACVHAKLLQSCPTLCDPIDCRPPGSSVHGILQARIPEWVSMPFSRGSSWPRDQTFISCNSSIAGRFFTAEPLGSKQYGGFSKKQSRTTMWSRNSTHGYISEDSEALIWKDIFTPVSIAALFAMAKIWKQLKCSSTGEWIKMLCVYGMEYYSATKKYKILPLQQHWWAWRILCLVLSFLRQRRTNTYITTYMWNLKNKTKKMNITKQKHTDWTI